jgi:hypothetical protein
MDTNRATGERGGPPAIVTVHGTNDAHPADAGDLWWQRGSPFTQTLAAELAARGIPAAEIVPHHWSGANSDADRLAAARNLADRLTSLSASGRLFAVLAHSHGGNIIMEALGLGGAGPASVVSFGTPFFTRKLKMVPWLIALFQVALGVIITPIMLGYIVAVLNSDTNKKIEGVILFGGLALIALASLRAGVRKLLHRYRAERALVRAFDNRRWLVLHSPRDEAMRLLEAAAELQPRYVTVASAERSLTAFASLAGVVGTLGLFGWHAEYFLEPVITKVKAGEYGFATAVDLTFILLFPVVFGAIYALIRIVSKIGGAWLYARTINLLIHGGVVGAAYGGDGAFHLTKVSRLPPYAPGAREARIDALNLGGIDDSAVFLAAQKLYDGVVASSSGEGGIGDPDIMWKRLSDALYHNAYMRDRGVIAGVAEFLVHGWRSSQG